MEPEFSLQGLTPIQPKVSKAPTEIWGPHTPLIPDPNHPSLQDFRFRTINIDFTYKTEGKNLDYKVSSFQMKSGFFKKYPGSQAMKVIHSMYDYLENELKNKNLQNTFGIDLHLFDQKFHSTIKERGVDVPLFTRCNRMVEFYIMPLVPMAQEDQTIVYLPRLFSLAMSKDKPKLKQAPKVTPQNNGWELIAQPQAQPQPQTPATTSTPSISGWVK